jgi:very-short-patch-repair endonuclease
MTPQERLIELLVYIEQVEKMRRVAPFKVPDDFFRGFQAQFQGLPGIEFNLVSGGDDVWARLARLKEELPPDPPESLSLWISVSKSPDKEPELREEIVVKKDEGTERRLTLTQFPGLRKTFATYYSDKWTPWARQERPRRKTMALYNKLFAIQQTMEVEGGEASLELVWGMGFALWKKPGAPATIEYPLLAQVCDISLNTKTFALEIRPRDADAVLDLDCYVDSEVEGVTQLQAWWRQYRDSAKTRPTPFELESTEPILRAAVGYLDPNGVFIVPVVGQESAVPVVKESLQMTSTWVLFVRRRSAQVFLQDIDRLKKNLKSEKNLPAAVSAFVSEGADAVKPRERIEFRGLSSSSAGAGVSELYFPMPYNAEQVAIVEKLTANDGVVVQGPPGTGKTHTIANVICHFLAHGKRVLVTSKGEEALRVLQEKIPQEIRSLSVALLTDEHTGMKQFEHSIQEIATTVSDMQPSRVVAEIEGYEARLGELHQKISALDHAISELAERQLSRIKLEDREISPEELARRVLEEQPEHSWLLDQLDPKAHAAPTFNNEDICALREARRRVRTDIQYLPCELPSADSLPSAETLVSLHRDLQRSRSIDQEVLDGQLIPLVDRTPGTFDKAKALAESLKKGEALAARIVANTRPWTARVRATLAGPKSDLSNQLLAACAQVLKLEMARRARLSHPVDALPGAEVDEDVNEGIGRLIEGKSVFALPFGKKAAREKIAQITVSGLKPESAEDWQRVREELEHRLSSRRLVATWNAVAPEFGIDGATASGSDALRKMVEAAEHIQAIYQLIKNVDQPLRPAAEEVFGSAVWTTLPKEPDLARPVVLASLAKHLDKSRLSYAMAQVDDLRKKLEGMSGVVVEGISALITKQLGSTDAPDADITNQWHEHSGELRRLAGLRPDLVVIERVTSEIERAGAAQWARDLRTEPAGAESDALLPATWLEAWRWRIAKSLLEGLDGHEELKVKFDRRKSAEGDLAKTYRALVASKAWLAVHENSPENVRQALQEYLNEIQAIGAGTGIRAIHHRQLARAAMERAYPAVPCWIMPQWRVSESIPPKIGSFDLVVIDEASQSDLWALPALLRGRKILVVGDHRQVSPSGVGLEEQKIKDLFNRYLTEQPHASQMRPDRSIYDLARVVFAGNSVMLKEHFRCVPAIIEFSKREFYEHEIKPLRLPKRSERLDPPLIDVFVKGGFRKGDVNEPEARAIVDEIASIIEDPAMVGRTLGVVTLLGNEQAKRIDELIRRKIPTHEIVARKIRVGEPPIFQGRESDIMLLSMVLQKGDRGLPDQIVHQQRMNVAASRARDRMILFRSIEASSINPESLTARLIAHFRQPFHQDAQKVAALRDLCESDFEREMYDDLTGRGFRVRPQVKVGGYRIDFVVEGTEDRRLAVECDGDRYHGPAQWGDDMIRQRVLERAGWTFWRCFASSFVLRRGQVLDDLFGTLKKMGIEPLGSESVDTTTWVASRTIDPLEEPEETEVRPRRPTVGRRR